jgi:CRP-like cAMP-binding protein
LQKKQISYKKGEIIIKEGTRVTDVLYVIEGLIKHIIRLEEIGYEDEYSYRPNIKQLNYFIDNELFGIKPVITTPFYDPEYQVLFDKHHAAYDLVPEDRHHSQDHFSIYWNRTRTGVILSKGFDIGYGFYILIGFET